MDGKAFFGSIHDEAAGTIGSSEEVSGVGVSYDFLDGIAHGTGAKTRVEPFQDKERQHVVVSFEAAALRGFGGSYV